MHEWHIVYSERWRPSCQIRCAFAFTPRFRVFLSSSEHFLSPFSLSLQLVAKVGTYEYLSPSLAFLINSSRGGGSGPM